jgi:hypothetical protein
MLERIGSFALFALKSRPLERPQGRASAHDGGLIAGGKTER